MVRRMAMDTYRAALAFFAAVLFLMAGVGADAAAGHVYDRAGLFTYSEEEQLEELAGQLEDTYGMNYLLLTTDDAEGDTSAAYAEAFYEENGYDTDGKAGGIVLLIDMDNRELNLVTNGDMIYYITDAREESIYDEGYSYASDGDYGDAMLAMLEQVRKYMKAGIPSNQYTYDTETGRIVRYKSLTAFDWGLALVLPLAVAAIACAVLWHRYSHVEKYVYSPADNADMKLTGQQDHLVNEFVTRREIPKAPPGAMGGRGGGGGRSSTHTSSGGGTYGGGHGRSF